MDYNLHQMRKRNKKIQKAFKRVEKSIISEIDFTDEVERDAYMFLKMSSEQLDALVEFLVEQEKRNKAA